MFLDTATITVRSGRGGNGAVAFRREAYVPKGGPSGGDGGRGGSVKIKVDPHMRTLVHFQRQQVFTAENGQNGAGGYKTGRSAKDLVIFVPPGTVIIDTDTDKPVADLLRKGDVLLAAKGGIGGHGNLFYATATRQAPRFSEMGERGEERKLRLELKLLADIGLVGYPNAGKSTLISRISAAKPKIAAYPFTTLIPNLGVVEIEGKRSFVVADVPGLIEGASEGIGLGHQFLRHVERTRALVHIVDAAGTEGRRPLDDYIIINRELALHDPELALRPQIVALNKLDVAQDMALVEEVEQAAIADGRVCFRISAVSGLGTSELVGHMIKLLDEIIPADEFAEQTPEPRQFEMPPLQHRRLEVRRMGEEVYIVRGTDVEQLVSRTNLDSEEGVERLHSELDRMGVLEKLEALGATFGDTVFIGDYELEYVPG